MAKAIDDRHKATCVPEQKVSKPSHSRALSLAGASVAPFGEVPATALPRELATFNWLRVFPAR